MRNIHSTWYGEVCTLDTHDSSLLGDHCDCYYNGNAECCLCANEGAKRLDEEREDDEKA